MSLKNIVKFGNYIPPAPSSFSISSPDLVKDYNMSNGDIKRYVIRNSQRQISASFNLTKYQLDEFKRHTRTGGEIAVTYDSETVYMLVTAYSEKVNNVRQKGNYTVNITFKESKR